MKPVRLSALMLVVVSGFTTAQFHVIRVPAEHATIQAALLAARQGTTILVERGTYGENLFWPRVDGIRLLAQEGPVVTIIHGGGLGRVVQFPSGLTRATVLEGFTLTGGFDRDGAGVRIFSSPTLRNNRITGNRGEHNLQNAGAGVYVTNGGTPLIEGNLIQDNRLDGGLIAQGAGIFVTGGAAPVIQANEILDNVCSGVLEAEGGGVYVHATAAAIAAGNVLARNTSTSLTAGRGGGAAVHGGPVFFFHNTVADNGVAGPTATGGGVYFGPRAAPGSRLVNNIVARNAAGGGIHVDGTAPPDLDYNDVWQNTGGDYRGVSPGKNDRSVDPAFAALTDYHLAPTSPLIDAGLNLPEAAATGTDPDGDPRFLDGNLDGLQGNAARADMGADEFSSARLEKFGTPWGGNRLLFQVSGPAGYLYHLFWSLDRANVLVQPFGQILIGAEAFPLASGALPGRDWVTLPRLYYLVGSRVHVQGLVLKAGTGPLKGNLTNRMSITVLDPVGGLVESFLDMNMMDPGKTTADWTLWPSLPGLHAAPGYGGTGVDGDLRLSGGLTLDSSIRNPGPDGIVAWDYQTLTIDPGGVLKLKGAYPIRINVRGNCVIEGTVDASGHNGVNAPAGPASQVGRIQGGSGGPGAGAGGAANPSPNNPLGALPMELRGGPGYPKANICGDVNKSDNRLITVIEPNCGGGTGGNRGRHSGTLLQSGCSGNGGGHMTTGFQTDYLCTNIGAFGREPCLNWIVAFGVTGVVYPTAGTGGGAGGNAAITTTNPTPDRDIVAGSGGGGGGGVEIVSFETLSLKGTARILATGGNGGAGHSTIAGSFTVSGGFGAGGAGGSIWLSGTSVVVESGAVVHATGGIGNPLPAIPTRTGNGGDGYIIIRDRGNTPTIQIGAKVTPGPTNQRALYDPPENGKSRAVSLFYDSGVSNPRWLFDANDPGTGEVVPGCDLVFLVPPVKGQKVFIDFQAAPDLNGKPDPDPNHWYPPGPDAFIPDISKIRKKGGLRHPRFRIRFDTGKVEEWKVWNRIGIEWVVVHY